MNSRSARDYRRDACEKCTSTITLISLCRKLLKYVARNDIRWRTKERREAQRGTCQVRAVRERVCSRMTGRWTHEEGTMDASSGDTSTEHASKCGLVIHVMGQRGIFKVAKISYQKDYLLQRVVETPRRIKIIRLHGGCLLQVLDRDSLT